MSNDLYSFLVGTRGLSVVHIQDGCGGPHPGIQWVTGHGMKLTTHTPSAKFRNDLAVHFHSADITVLSCSLKRVQFNCFAWGNMLL